MNLRPLSTSIGLGWLLLLSGCVPGSDILRQSTLATGAFYGLSGLARDERGAYWAVADKHTFLLPLTLDRRAPGLSGPAIPIPGVPAEHDLESIASLDANRFAIGLEQRKACRDPIDLKVLFVVREGNQARVEQQLRVPVERWRLSLSPNHGIEGLCRVGSHLFLAVELVQQRSGKRLAPIFRYDLERQTWTLFWLELSSPSGKLSSLACRAAPTGSRAEIALIERHFDVLHLLTAELPLTGKGRALKPRQVRDLQPLLPGRPNLEACDFASENSLVCINDNHWGQITGPTQAIWLKLH